MADAPDIYAESFWFGPAASGMVTLTLMAEMPDGQGGAIAGVVVARVRMSPGMALDLARVIGENVKAVVEPPDQRTH